MNMEEYYELKRFLLNEDLAKKWHELLEWTDLNEDELYEYMVNKMYESLLKHKERFGYYATK